MGPVMIAMMIICGGFMLYMHKDGMMMSHGNHGAKTEEVKNAPSNTNDNKAVPSKTDEGNENPTEEHKHHH